MRVNFKDAINLSIEDGPTIFAYRCWKLGRLFFLKTFGYWQRLEADIHVFWDHDRINQWLKITRDNKAFIGSNKASAFRDWAHAHHSWVQEINAEAEKILLGHIKIFDQEYSLDIHRLPWHSDWRLPYIWIPDYFRAYNFYHRKKEVPAEVKFPWELSRFAFLLPLAQTALLSNKKEYYEVIARVIRDWELKNPVAFSVNWFPMECAMRGINFTIAAQILAALETLEAHYMAPLLRELTLQGEFLVKNIEFSKFRNNHYASNLIGLLVIGAALHSIYPPARHWVTFAKRKIFNEIEQQYFRDGVHFEKSISYHRLVTELFLLGLLVLEHIGQTVPDNIRQLMHNACRYSRSYTRPDGLAANFGDNDGARVCSFDPWPIRNHGALLAVAAVYFSDASLKPPLNQTSAAIPWLLGQEGVLKWAELENVPKGETGSHCFKDGGMFISRSDGNYLIADYGEVGTRGRGGHGHNDTFSFELVIGGKAVMVDPGSPIYTGNLEMLDHFSNTGCHNTVRIDGQEMARRFGIWRIAPDATPSQVECQIGEEFDSIEGLHQGYRRLPDPVIHTRRLTFQKHVGKLICSDRLECSGTHEVERFFYFAPGLELLLEENELRVVMGPGEIITVTWFPRSEARLEPAAISEVFGKLETTQKLILKNTITGNTEITFEVSPYKVKTI